MNQYRRFFFIKNNKVFVSDDIYKEMNHITNRNNYVTKLNIINRLIYVSAYDSDEFDGSDLFKDTKPLAFDIVFKNFVIEKVREAVSLLDEDEQRLIEYIFYNNFSLRHIARLENSYPKKIARDRDRVLSKLRLFLENDFGDDFLN